MAWKEEEGRRGAVLEEKTLEDIRKQRKGEWIGGRGYKDAGVEFGTMLKEVNLCLVQFGLAEVDVHIVVGLGATDQCLAVPEEIIRVGVGKVAVAPEGSVVVLQDTVVVLLDNGADEVSLGLVPLDLTFSLEQILSVQGDVGCVAAA